MPSECILLKGGGGVDLDVITAEAGDIIKGKVIVGTDGEPLTGTLALSGNATTAHVYAGDTFYSTNAKKKLTGSMAIQSAINFKATTQSTSVIRISWTNPSKGPWTGVKIRMSTSGSPGLSGGTLKYTGTGSSTTPSGTSYVDITGLEVSTTYYFTCYSYVTGLGDSTTGYNVSAKTNGLLLYSYGNNYANFAPQVSSQLGNTVKFNSDHIYISMGRNTRPRLISASTYNIANYTNAYVTISCSSGQYMRWCAFNGYDGNNFYGETTTGDGRVTISGSANQIITNYKVIPAAMKGNYRVAIQPICYNSSPSVTDYMNATFNIYKVWLE